MTSEKFHCKNSDNTAALNAIYLRTAGLCVKHYFPLFYPFIQLPCFPFSPLYFSISLCSPINFPIFIFYVY